MNALKNFDYIPPSERLWNKVRFEPRGRLQKLLRSLIEVIYFLIAPFFSLIDDVVLLFADREQFNARRQLVAEHTKEITECKTIGDGIALAYSFCLLCISSWLIAIAVSPPDNSRHDVIAVEERIEKPSFKNTHFQQILKLSELRA